MSGESAIHEWAKTVPRDPVSLTPQQWQTLKAALATAFDAACDVAATTARAEVCAEIERRLDEGWKPQGSIREYERGVLAGRDQAADIVREVAKRRMGLKCWNECERSAS